MYIRKVAALASIGTALVALTSCGTKNHSAAATVLVADGTNHAWSADLRRDGAKECFRVQRGRAVIADDCGLPDGPPLNLAIDLAQSADLFYGYARDSVRTIEVDLINGTRKDVPLTRRGGRIYFCYSPPASSRVGNIRAVGKNGAVVENTSDKIAAAYAQSEGSR